MSAKRQRRAGGRVASWGSKRVTVAQIVDRLARIAPPSLAQEWDNVGLLAGDLGAGARRVLLAIDLTRPVVEEARAGGFELVVAYHPPIFRPLRALTLPSGDTGGLVFECIRSGIAIYSPHTALDAAEGGTNDTIAELCGIGRTTSIEYVDRPGGEQFKLIVFAPADDLDDVAEALFSAGAGRIGDYTHCSFRIPGEGTFFGTESTNPTVGARGRLERVAETRMECVVSAGDLPAAVAALRRAHPYEEPAFDLFPLKPEPVQGIGRVGVLPRQMSLKSLGRKLRQATGSRNVQLIGDPDRVLERAVIVVGSAGSLPFRVDLTPREVIITGEIRHHDALSILRRDCSAIALGHWESERPVLARLAARLGAELPNVQLSVSKADQPAARPVG